MGIPNMDRLADRVNRELEKHGLRFRTKDRGFEDSRYNTEEYFQLRALKDVGRAQYEFSQLIHTDDFAQLGADRLAEDFCRLALMALKEAGEAAVGGAASP